MNFVPIAPSDGCRVAKTHALRALLTEKAAADYLTFHPRNLQKMRQKGDGPAYSKLGRRIVYRLEDLDAWVEAHAVRSVGDAR